MIELIFLSVCVCVIGTWIAVVVTAITLHDFRMIRMEQVRKQHPHARKWRGSQQLRSKLILNKNKSAIVSKTDERIAVSLIQFHPATRSVEIIPRLEFPETVDTFFATYHQIALTPFTKIRTIFGVRPPDRIWPVLSWKKLPRTRWEMWYPIARRVICTINAALLTYIGYVAIALSQNEYLFAYAGLFSLWLVWTIASHPQLIWRQKFAYLALAPASLAYFVWRAFTAPFRYGGFRALRPKPRRVLS